eukprot:scaffold51671_cov26-Tisochrysis_lutea.AAC.7
MGGAEKVDQRLGDRRRPAARECNPWARSARALADEGAGRLAQLFPRVRGADRRDQHQDARGESNCAKLALRVNVPRRAAVTREPGVGSPAARQPVWPGRR